MDSKMSRARTGRCPAPAVARSTGSPTSPSPPVTTRTHDASGYLVVAVSGVLDSATAATLGHDLLSVSDEKHRRAGLILDLSGVDRLEAYAVATAMMTYWRATSLDNGLRLVAPKPPAGEPLLSARLDWLVPIYPTVQHAVAAGPEAE